MTLPKDDTANAPADLVREVANIITDGRDEGSDYDIARAVLARLASKAADPLPSVEDVRQAQFSDPDSPRFWDANVRDGVAYALKMTKAVIVPILAAHKAQARDEASKIYSAILREKGDAIVILEAAGAKRERAEANEHGRMHPRTLPEQVAELARMHKAAESAEAMWRERCHVIEDQRARDVGATLDERDALRARVAELEAERGRWQGATGCIDPDTIRDALWRIRKEAECDVFEGIPDGIAKIKKERDEARASKPTPPELPDTERPHWGADGEGMCSAPASIGVTKPPPPPPAAAPHRTMPRSEDIDAVIKDGLRNGDSPMVTTRALLDLFHVACSRPKPCHCEACFTTEDAKAWDAEWDGAK